MSSLREPGQEVHLGEAVLKGSPRSGIGARMLSTSVGLASTRAVLLMSQRSTRRTWKLPHQTMTMGRELNAQTKKSSVILAARIRKGRVVDALALERSILLVCGLRRRSMRVFIIPRKGRMSETLTAFLSFFIFIPLYITSFIQPGWMDARDGLLLYFFFLFLYFPNFGLNLNLNRLVVLITFPFPYFLYFSPPPPGNTGFGGRRLMGTIARSNCCSLIAFGVSGWVFLNLRATVR